VALLLHFAGSDAFVQWKRKYAKNRSRCVSAKRLLFISDGAVQCALNNGQIFLWTQLHLMDGSLFAFVIQNG